MTDTAKLIQKTHNNLSSHQILNNLKEIVFYYINFDELDGKDAESNELF